MQFTIIGNPSNRRCQYFVAAIQSQGLPLPIVVSYLDILQSKINLEAILSKTNYLRIESFGENFEVKRHLLALGAKRPLLGHASSILAPQALQLDFDKGRIQYLKQLNLGYTHFLNHIDQILKKYPLVQPLNTPKSIQLMFNKIACHQHFLSNNIPVIPAIYDVQNYEDLCIKIKEKKWQNIFIKPAYSSSASGVIALKINGNKIKAITSAKLVKNKDNIKIYNSLKLSTYTSLWEVKFLVDTLAKEDIIVEQWIPKANTPKGGSFDLRILTIGGKARHIVMRQSQSPLTNLHLGNQRGDLVALKQQFGSKKWQSIIDTAEMAAQTIPKALYIGLDVLVANNHKKNYIIEANAFGDLLPNVLVNGLDSYQAQIAYLQKTI